MRSLVKPKKIVTVVVPSKHADQKQKTIMVSIVLMIPPLTTVQSHVMKQKERLFANPTNHLPGANPKSSVSHDQ